MLEIILLKLKSVERPETIKSIYLLLNGCRYHQYQKHLQENRKRRYLYHHYYLLRNRNSQYPKVLQPPSEDLIWRLSQKVLPTHFHSPLIVHHSPLIDLVDPTILPTQQLLLGKIGFRPCLPSTRIHLSHHHPEQCRVHHITQGRVLHRFNPSRPMFHRPLFTRRFAPLIHNRHQILSLDTVLIVTSLPTLTRHQHPVFLHIGRQPYPHRRGETLHQKSNESTK